MDCSDREGCDAGSPPEHIDDAVSFGKTNLLATPSSISSFIDRLLS